MENKNWYQSKTLIIGILEILIGLGLYLKGQVEVGAVITSAGIIQAILRTITTAGLNLGGKKKVVKKEE